MRPLAAIPPDSQKMVLHYFSFFFFFLSGSRKKKLQVDKDWELWKVNSPHYRGTRLCEARFACSNMILGQT